MSNVIHLDEHRPDPHYVAQPECLHCFYEWTAVYPVDLKVLQCPRCDQFTIAPHLDPDYGD